MRNINFPPAATHQLIHVDCLWWCASTIFWNWWSPIAGARLYTQNSSRRSSGKVSVSHHARHAQLDDTDLVPVTKAGLTLAWSCTSDTSLFRNASILLIQRRMDQMRVLLETTFWLIIGLLVRRLYVNSTVITNKQIYYLSKVWFAQIKYGAFSNIFKKPIL